MIKSYQDYKLYLEADRTSLGSPRTLKNWLLDDIWRFERTMRYLEYLSNCNKNPVLRTLVAYVYHRRGAKLGFSIPKNVFGPGLSIAHRGTIVVNPDARIGANCRLHACVNIGTAADRDHAAPKLGDNCYIGPGAKLFGDITIGSNTVIGANAVVNKSFPCGAVTLGGVPAKVISDRDSDGLLIRGYSVE